MKFFMKFQLWRFLIVVAEREEKVYTFLYFHLFTLICMCAFPYLKKSKAVRAAMCIKRQI